MNNGYDYNPQQIRQKLYAVMKSTNPELQQSDEEKDKQKLKKDIEQHQVDLQQAVEFMKKVLLTEIFGHLKQKHGIYEKSDAEWYYSDTQEWAKQYCIFTWDENRRAIPKYWCDSGCKECDELYKKYQSTMDIADEARIKAINGIQSVKEEIKRLEYEQKSKSQQGYQINKNLNNQMLQQKKK